MRRWLVTMAWSALLLPAPSEVLRPSLASSEREVQTKSQSSAESFDPVKCSVTEPIGVTMGDLVSCASPEPEEGPAGGFPGGPDPENYDRKPGDDYAGLHGEPKRLPRPANCATPVRGTFTFDGGVLTRVSERNGRRVREMYFHTHYTSGFGEGGRSVLALDMWDDPDTGDVVFVGRELYEGTVAGRTGSLTIWNYGRAEPDGKAVGRAFSIGGTEGLANLRFEANFANFVPKGSGHWTEPSWMCFAD